MVKGSALSSRSHALEDFDRLVVFCDLNSLETAGEQGRIDVTAIHTAVQVLAHGFGILDHDNAETFNTTIVGLSRLGR